IMNQGRILRQASPLAATNELDGKIWARNIAPSELDSFRAKTHLLSSGFNPDHSLKIRVFADAQPDKDFATVPPALEDVYFLALNQPDFQTV
ncbi:MAG: ABC transporter ATP-binding protein, partial [Bacteroidota bacterium]